MKGKIQKVVGLFRFGLEELKFLRSSKDLKILFDQKLPFMMPKLTGHAATDAGTPLSLQIEPTNHCNLSCICCSKERMKRARGYMDLGLFRKIVAEASRAGVKRVHLYLHGEPFLHPRIVEMIGAAKAQGLGLTIATNGTALDKRMIGRMLLSGMNSADYITFSILGCSKNVHEKIMRGADHERVVKNVSDLLEMRRLLKNNGPLIEAIFYEMPENEGEKELFHTKWRGVVDHVRSGGRISRQFSKGADDASSIPLRQSTCKNLWQRMTVYWNGDVTTCIADVDGERVMGNLQERSINDIWNCGQMEYIRKRHRERRFGDLPLCSTCDW